MRIYDWKSNDTRDIIVSHPFGESWEFNAETKLATDFLNKLCGPGYKFVHTLEDGVLWTEDKASFDMLFNIIKGTNFVVDLHLGESK